MREEVIRASKAASVGGLFHLPRRQLFAFNIVRFGDISSRHFSQRYFRFVITDIVGVPLTVGGLISQIDGARGHGIENSYAAAHFTGSVVIQSNDFASFS